MAELPDVRALWLDTSPELPAPNRAGGAVPAEAEIVVAGAGIAGLTTAYLLAEAGCSVLVLEARSVAGGVAERTTARLSAQHGLIYDRLATRRGPAAAASFGASQLATLDWVTSTARALDIDCELERTDSYVYTTSSARRAALRAEAEAARAAGLPASYLDGVDLPLPVAGAVRFAGQARCHPRRWLLGLAARIEALGGRIVEGVRVTGVRSGRPALVRTTSGVVRAGQVVVAALLARGSFFARLDQVRSLVLAGPRPAGLTLSGMYLDADTRHSVSLARAGGEELLVVGGERYRVGDGVDVRARYARLGAWAREHLGLTDPRYRWSVRDMSTVDGVPHVGRYHPGSRNLWVATGFGQWGMTGGTAAGLLLRDLVLGRRNELAPLYEPTRLPPPRVPTDRLRASANLANLSPKAQWTAEPELSALVARHGVTTVGASPLGARRRGPSRSRRLGSHAGRT